MKLVLLTNDNFFSFTVLKPFLEEYKGEIKLIIFSSALIGKKGRGESIKWSIKNTGLSHTIFKLSVYGIFRFMKLLCKIFPFIKNNYSSYLWAQRNKLNYICTENINNPEIVEKIKKEEPDLIVSVSMNQIVKKEILNLPKKKSINVHCAPLPKYAGMSPYVWALANNEGHSAATIHYMEEGLDEGNIIVQDRVMVQKKDSAFSLFYRCCLKAAKQLLNVIHDFEKGTVDSYPQDLSQRSYFSWPDKQCIRNLHKNGYKLATVKDFYLAILKQKNRD